jgi:RecA/RadA recombinase
MPVTDLEREKFLSWIADQGKSGGRATAVHHAGTSLAEAAWRIPFISPTMTYASADGMPIGQMGRWYGPEGSGKSMSNWGLTYCAQNYPQIMTEKLEREIRYWEAKRSRLKAKLLARRIKAICDRFPDGMSVCIWDTEQRAQLDLAARLGVNLRKDKFLLVEENVIEEVIRQMTAALGAYHILIVDSASNAQSYAEANLEPGDYEQGTASQAWKRLRQTRRRLDRLENTIIFVDQMRMQLGQKTWGGPRPKPPQNRFLKHNVSLAFEFDEGRKLYLNDELLLTDDKKKASEDFRQLGSDYPEIAGLEMRARTEKNSTGKPYRNCIMRFKFPMFDTRSGEMVQDVGFDLPYEILQVAMHFHIVEVGGSGMFYLLDEDFQRVKVQGKGKARKDKSWRGEWNAAVGLWEDEELRERVLERLRRAT